MALAEQTHAAYGVDQFDSDFDNRSLGHCELKVGFKRKLALVNFESIWGSFIPICQDRISQGSIAMERLIMGHQMHAIEIERDRGP